jgi:2-amino-4-hydroxy-6-hydroxymethyldihydropteridine diphosphokinase
MPEIFVGLGSNIEPEANLRAALAALRLRFGELACSSVYRSPAHGFDGPEFLNMVVGFSADVGVDALEVALSELENAAGRGAGDRSGSRTLDLDLLLFGERVDAARRLPRADILEYPFVLAPLSEIAPDLVHPVTGVTLQRAWMSIAGRVDALRRIGALDAA